MPYKAKANFTGKDGLVFIAGEVYEKSDPLNADLMEETKEKVTADTLPTTVEINAKEPKEKTVMTKADIKTK